VLLSASPSRTTSATGNIVLGAEIVDAAIKGQVPTSYHGVPPKGLPDSLRRARRVQLSGVNASRVAIARAILSRPRILIIDEATSRSTPQSENLGAASAGIADHGRTSLIIGSRVNVRRTPICLYVVKVTALPSRNATHADCSARRRHLCTLSELQHWTVATAE